MNQNISNLLLSNLETLGRWYVHDNLDRWNVSRLEIDWWHGLDFFFSHSFYRGRRDELSNEYYSFSIQRLKEIVGNVEAPDGRLARLLRLSECFGSDSIIEFKSRHHLGKRNSLKDPKFAEEVAATNELVDLLTTTTLVTVDFAGDPCQKKIRLGNEEDLMMVLDTLRLVCQLEHGNIYRHLKDLIDTEGPRTAFDSLQGLRAVGDKIASFVMRDIGLLNPGLVTADFDLAFPVDTWVRRLAVDIGHKGKGDASVKQLFIEESHRQQCDPLLVAAGLWYAGYNALRILLTAYLGRGELPKTMSGLIEPSNTYQQKPSMALQ